MAYDPETEKFGEVIWPPADTEQPLDVDEELARIDVALARQEGGAHYKGLAIQPVEYIMANGIGFVEGSVIKYVSRWRAKGGVEDLRKARHFLDILIEAQGQVE